ncbi:MAG: phosphatase PAP2 family protein [Fimbriimonadaceae bacterium]|nr:phosphatase PAP2 family protein [Fimbriimonadaceae bacterium]
MTWLWDLDLRVFRWIHVDGHRAWLDPVFWVISSTGLGYVQVIVVLLIGLRPTFRPYLPSVLAATLFSMLTPTLVKPLVPRMRPSNLAIASPQETFFYSSYPSGHTTSAFGIATIVLLLTWPTRQRWMGLVTLLWAMLVGFSRVYRGVHWPTDVLGGACLGVASSGIVCLVLVGLGRWPRSQPSI